MGGSTSGDGRLNFDDLDGVLTEAASLDVVSAGEEPRLGDRIAATPTGRWLSRHRVVLISAGAALSLLVATVILAVRLLPPPLDPTLRIGVTAAEPLEAPGDIRGEPSRGGMIVSTDIGVRRASYRLHPHSLEDANTYTITGLLGPAVRASAAHPLADGETFFGANLDVVVDCRDPAVLTPTTNEYSLLITRVDEHGRRLDATLPLGIADLWPAHLASTCLAERLPTDLRINSIHAASPPGVRTVQLHLEVTNELPQPLGWTGTEGGDDTYTTRESLSDIPARSTTTVHINIDVQDCATPARPVIWQRGHHQPEGTPGIWVDISTDTGISMTTPLVWTKQQQRSVEHALKRACDGAPRTTARVLAATARQTSDYMKSATVDLQVATSGTHVRIEPLPYSPLQFPATAAKVTAGRATVRLPVEFSCDSLDATHRMRIMVSTKRSNFPFLADMDTPQMTQAVVAACQPFTTVQELVEDFGWMPPPGYTPPS